MNKQKPIYDLSEFANGEIQEQFDKAMQEVFQNMQDVNTPYKPKRSITIKVSFEQNEARDDMNVDVSIDRKLASASTIKTKMAIAKDLRTGKIVAEEYGKQIKGQMSFADLDMQEGQEGVAEPEVPTPAPQVTGARVAPMPVRKVIGG